MRRELLPLLWLTTAWVLFWRDLSLANLLAGAALGAVVLALFPFREQMRPLTLRPLPMLRFVAVFAWSVVKANVVIAWEVLTPWNRIEEGVVTVALSTDHPMAVTMVSHAIILAPGTMVIDIDQSATPVLYVHALHLRSVDIVRRDVERLERLAVEALGIEISPLPRRTVTP